MVRSSVCREGGTVSQRTQPPARGREKDGAHLLRLRWIDGTITDRRATALWELRSVLLSLRRTGPVMSPATVLPFRLGCRTMLASARYFLTPTSVGHCSATCLIPVRSIEATALIGLVAARFPVVVFAVRVPAAMSVVFAVHDDMDGGG